MSKPFSRCYDFESPLDDLWDIPPGRKWTMDITAAGATLVNRPDPEECDPDRRPRRASITLRPGGTYGDRIDLIFDKHAPRRGLLEACFSGTMEFLTFELDFASGNLIFKTHEHHKFQPRLETRVTGEFTTLSFERDRTNLPGLPYEGSVVRVLVDGRVVAEIDHCDFQPDCHFMFGLIGPGEMTLRAVELHGPARDQVEYVNLGLYRRDRVGTIAGHVDALLNGARQAAEQGVELLLTPETSLTGLRPYDQDLFDEPLIQAQLKRFTDGVAKIPNAPHVMVGFPEWIDGKRVDGAQLDRVRVNSHRWVRPDGTLGPRMAKVHSCEPGLWHGRHYNFQQVRGVKTIMGVCHDASYPDVWRVGVMGGAKLCLHAVAGGVLTGEIPRIVEGYKNMAAKFSAFWAFVNAGGGGAIVHPNPPSNRPEHVLAVTPDLTEQSPTYPTYSDQGDQFCFARIRLWDVHRGLPCRTLRGGAAHYRAWSSLIPELAVV